MIWRYHDGMKGSQYISNSCWHRHTCPPWNSGLVKDIVLLEVKWLEHLHIKSAAAFMSLSIEPPSSMTVSFSTETPHSFSTSIRNNWNPILVRLSSNHHLKQLFLSEHLDPTFGVLDGQANFRQPPCYRCSLWESWEYNLCLLITRNATLSTVSLSHIFN